MKKGYLLLEDGTRYEGYSFGAEISQIGEVVFNTAMNGYPESLTDPSYMGQILVETYPMVGNYGMPAKSLSDGTGIYDFFESGRMWVQGLIVADYCEHYSHWNAHSSLQECLIKEGVPALTGIDTRALTKHLRDNGCMKGSIVIEGIETPAIDQHFEEKNLVSKASTKEIIAYGNGAKTVLFIDCGTKHNILRRLIRPEITLIRVPWDYDISQTEYDGLFVSNGPGDPKKCDKTIASLRKAFEGDKPICGICMGNQLFGLAAGADIFKLKYGHRSHNQPVREVGTEQCYITSQNHSYAVNPATLPNSWEEWFINLNDGTNEGLRHKTKPFFSVQFHPECCGGPTDTLSIFDKFLGIVLNQ